MIGVRKKLCTFNCVSFQDIGLQAICCWAASFRSPFGKGTIGEIV